MHSNFLNRPKSGVCMLTVYHSNRLDVLAELMSSLVVDQPLSDPFDPEVVLVQSRGMAEWLQITLAEKLGIAVNLQFPLLESFMWEMYTRVLPDIPKKSAFSRPSMRWKLMSLLPEILHRKEFAIFQNYLNSDDRNEENLFHLASHVAKLYHQYMVYRPDWINAWESGLMVDSLPRTQFWQAELWKALIELINLLGESRCHHANLYNRLIGTLKSKSERPPNLPLRIFIFNISSFPPIYLNVIKALGKYVDLYIFFINPCRYYWGDIQDSLSLEGLLTRQRCCLFKKGLVPLFKENKNVAKPFNKKGLQKIPNPLLSSWGQIGRDCIHMLYEIFSSKEENLVEGDIDAFVGVVQDSLLHNVQNDILNLENLAISGISSKEFSHSDIKRRLDLKDRSFTVHVCHSPHREVEVLHDCLLRMFEDDPSLTPRDILVMVSDIDTYSPYVQGVFGGATGKRFIPYAISERQTDQSYPTIQVFIKLLSLFESRFISEDVLALLESPVLSARFNIDEEGLRYLRKWVDESGVRWGLDDDNVKELGLPVTGQHTWKFGLTRMLLGYAMESREGEWKDVLPYDESSGRIAELVGHLSVLLMKLTFWHRELKQARFLEAWLPLCREMLNDFFLPKSATSEAELGFIKQQWQEIISEGIVSQYKKAVSFSLLRDELIQRLKRENIKQSFVAGSINFCTFMLMRTIPFRVVCLLGMNDGVYPRTFPPLEFDLISREPKRGDVNRRSNDAYLFLEALLSAQKTFYVSYIGRSIRDNSERFPSILVQELIDYIGQSHYLAGDETRNCDESERHIKAHITFYHTRMPFDPLNYEHNNEHQSYVQEWLPVAKKKGTPQRDFIQILEPLPIKTISFEQLQSFWLHPVRFFFQQRLQVNLRSKESDRSDTEPFNLEGLNLYYLNQELLDLLVDQKEDIQTLFRRYRTAGQLPYGVFGEVIWEKQYQEMKALAKRIIEYRQPGRNIEINLNCDGIHLTGWIKNVQADGLLRWRPSIFSVSQGLQLWLEHLVYSASGNEGVSRLFLRQDREWCFPPIPVRMAQDYLNRFILGYLQGMNEPLLLLPESGGVWVQACYDVKRDSILTDKSSLQKARSKFLQRYKGNMLIRGESKDIWYRRLSRKIELEAFDVITKEALRYLLPLFKFKRY